MPLPTYQGADGKKPCGAEYRQGATCRFGANCKFDHTPIDRLAPETQKLWHDHVKATEGMSFNVARVKSGVAAVNAAVKTAATKPKTTK